MSYENEIKHLMRELKFAKSDYLNTRLKSEDALRIHAFKTDVETIEFQIEVFEKATKADEYEAKATTSDRIVKESKGTFSCGDFCDDVRHIINSYEIGVATDE